MFYVKITEFKSTTVPSQDCKNPLCFVMCATLISTNKDSTFLQMSV